MNELSNQVTQEKAFQSPNQRGLSDAKMKELLKLTDPPYEQESPDIM